MKPKWTQSTNFRKKVRRAAKEAKQNVQGLNSTQLEAIEAGLQRTLTMWEG